MRVPYHSFSFSQAVSIIDLLAGRSTVVEHLLHFEQHASYSEPTARDWTALDAVLQDGRHFEPSRQVTFRLARMRQPVVPSNNVAEHADIPSMHISNSERLWRDDLRDFLPLTCGKYAPKVVYLHASDPEDDHWTWEVLNAKTEVSYYAVYEWNI